MNGKRGPWRSTIRVRLSLFYAGAFFLAGAVLVAVMYLVVGQALDRQLTARLGISEHLPDAISTEPNSTQAAHDLQEELRAQFEQDRDDTLDTVLVASLIALGVIGLLAGASGWLLAGRALRPLQEITATARRVADPSLHERIALEGPPDEIKDLADTFDAMLERLDRAFDGQRRFVANASHELRMPLTINRTLLEVALDDPRASESLRQLGATLLAVNARHERLIDGLLTLARSDQRLADPVPVDLAEVVRHVITGSEAAARTEGVEIQADLRPASVAGDPLLLERLAHNLLDNAIRYNVPQGGRVVVATGMDAGNACLTVANSGRPVPAYEMPNLFEPFRRLPDADGLATTSSARGVGLGLSIVRAVAHAHGGDVRASPKEDGGLVVRVQLPTSTPGSMPKGAR